MAFKPYDVKSKTEADFVVDMVVKSVELLDSYNYQLKYKFLLGFTTHIIFSALKLIPKDPCSKEELYKFTENNFVTAKYNIQEMIAGAFSQALTLYSGKKVDYTCKVEPTPSGNTKLMN